MAQIKDTKTDREEYVKKHVAATTSAFTVSDSTTSALAVSTSSGRATATILRHCTSYYTPVRAQQQCARRQWSTGSYLQRSIPIHVIRGTTGRTSQRPIRYRRTWYNSGSSQGNYTWFHQRVARSSIHYHSPLCWRASKQEVILHVWRWCSLLQAS